MTFLDLLGISSSALLKHKVRSGLTLLGIVIGILSVSAISTVVGGIDRYMADLLGSMGSQGFVVSRIGMPTSEEEFLRALKRRKIPPSAAEVIKTECALVAHAAPFVRTFSEVKTQRLNVDDVTIEGTTEDAQYMDDIGLDAGRYFTPYEVEHGRQVCIVGADVAAKIFTNPDVVDRTVQIKGHRFKVIGSHARMGTIMGISRDSFVWIPYTTFEKIFGRGYPAEISVQSRSPESILLAIEEVRTVMRRLRKLRLKQDDDFGILTSEALMKMWRRLTTNVFLASIGVAGISLLVGGIGIMNIMFVSVKERTNEIGIRKAMGATRRQIMSQFLTESSLLCLIGGGLGVSLGVGAAAILSWQTHVPVSVEWWAVASSLGVAVGVGVFFGVYPAVKAAGLDAVTALGYEK
jgi:putative ABC transport system permease protein